MPSSTVDRHADRAETGRARADGARSPTQSLSADPLAPLAALLVEAEGVGLRAGRLTGRDLGGAPRGASCIGSAP